MTPYLSSAPNRRKIGILSVWLSLFCGNMGCSTANENLQPWPAGPRVKTDDSSNAEQPGDENEETSAETFSTESTSDQSTLPDSSTSAGSSSSSKEQTESSPDTTSEPNPTSEPEKEKSDEDIPDPDACVQKVCAELNPQNQGTSDPSEVGQYIFYFETQDWARRLARVELVEGFVSGETSIVVKSDGGDKHGDVIAQLSWTKRPSDLLDWTGDNLPTPVNIENETWLWLEVTPAQGVFSSLATTGESVPVWERNEPGRAWRKGSAPVMFRAYCCEESSRHF